MKKITIILAFLWMYGWAANAAAVAITDKVRVGEIEWAQVDLFRGVSWNEIDVLCPASSRSCLERSELKGFNLFGWTWACCF